MAPSATVEATEGVLNLEKKVDVSKGLDQTPLEAISHGPLVFPGELRRFFASCLEFRLRGRYL